MKLKIKALYEKIYNKLKPYWKRLILPLLKIIGIIIVCAVLSHLLGGSETLAEYAEAGSK